MSGFGHRDAFLCYTIPPLEPRLPDDEEPPHWVLPTADHLVPVSQHDAACDAMAMSSSAHQSWIDDQDATPVHIHLFANLGFPNDSYGFKVFEYQLQPILGQPGARLPACLPAYEQDMWFTHARWLRNSHWTSYPLAHGSHLLLSRDMQTIEAALIHPRGSAKLQSGVDPIGYLCDMKRMSKSYEELLQPIAFDPFSGRACFGERKGYLAIADFLLPRCQ
jgi:hypothetical protein